VIDDGSADGTRRLLADWQRRDSRIRVVRRPRNSGDPCVARNEGIAVAESPYFAYIDDDNAWRPCHLEALLEAVARCPDLALAYGDRLCHYPDGTTGPGGAAIDTGDVLHPREVWDALPERWVQDPRRLGQEDQYLWRRVRDRYGSVFVHVNEVISDFYFHGSNYYVVSPRTAPDPEGRPAAQ